MRSTTGNLAAVMALVLLACLAGAQPGLAFGAVGHRVVAQIASWQLQPSVAREVRRLLEGGSLVEASTWADEVRGEEQYRYLSPWHYVNLDPQTGRFEGCPEAGCVVDALGSAVRALGDRDRPDAERRLALRLIAHFVGDVHQPLHVSHAEDRGGNRIVVDFFGEEWNLHSVWDTGIISRRRGSWRRLARQLVETPRDLDATWNDAAVLRWVEESYALATRVVYPSASAGARLGRRYVLAHRPLVDVQLHKAGLRLGALLNEVLGEAAPR